MGAAARVRRRAELDDGGMLISPRAVQDPCCVHCRETLRSVRGEQDESKAVAPKAADTRSARSGESESPENARAQLSRCARGTFDARLVAHRRTSPSRRAKRVSSASTCYPTA